MRPATGTPASRAASGCEGSDAARCRLAQPRPRPRPAGWLTSRRGAAQADEQAWGRGAGCARRGRSLCRCWGASWSSSATARPRCPPTHPAGSGRSGCPKPGGLHHGAAARLHGDAVPATRRGIATWPRAAAGEAGAGPRRRAAGDARWGKRRGGGWCFRTLLSRL